MNEPDVIVEVAVLTAAPGQDGELLELFRKSIAPSRREEGCLRYELNQDAGDPRRLTVTAKFAGRAMFEKHLSSRHVRRFAESAAGIVESTAVRMCGELLPSAAPRAAADPQAVVIIAEFTAKEGKTEELSNVLQTMVEPTRHEPGCLRYELNQDLSESAAFVFVEAYKDRAAFDAHCGMPYFKALLEALPPLVETQYVSVNREVPA